MFAGAAVHGAGLGDGLDQVFVISVPPAPPADLRLAATGDHSTILLVPGIKRCRKRKMILFLCEQARKNPGVSVCVNLPIDDHRDPLPGSEGGHTLQLLVCDPYGNQKLPWVA